MELHFLIDKIDSGQSGDVCIDSRQVKDSDIFVAIKGTVSDGHDFIPQAISNGAKTIVHDRSYEPNGISDVEFIAVDDTALAAGILSQVSCGRPYSKLTSLAVTGTNGKTTTSSMVKFVIENSGKKCGLIGTIANDICGEAKVLEANMTTPDAITLASLMQQMVENGAQYMCLEASSHALEQRRLASISFKAAAFTNLTGDHLDYHKTMDNYLAAKSLLFEGLGKTDVAILNLDDKYSRRIAQRCDCDVLWYSVKDSSADIYADIERLDQGGSVYQLCVDGRRLVVKSCFCGLHNVSNQLAAAGLCIAAGFNLDTIAEGLSNFKNVPGRLERVECGQKFTVFVDYAHTDDALENVLSTLKPICEGKLITVFGCGGDRDKTKRPRMAQAAEKYSDIVWVTSDNPRTEDPESIITDIKAGFSNKNDCVINIEPNRSVAIRKAVEIAGYGDIMLIAGKGHENYQVIGNKKHHFDDREEVEKCIRSQI
ncbi:MAG: UDP-N-acetylmuramoyl-L-alanyl-D-glutamate--2,6-diaminopimelate ligase [Sedimentisphaeraceae bacterium JB056]